MSTSISAGIGTKQPHKSQFSEHFYNIGVWDDEGVGETHKIVSSKNFPDDNGAALVRSQTSFQIDLKCLQKVTTEF